MIFLTELENWIKLIEATDKNQDKGAIKKRIMVQHWYNVRKAKEVYKAIRLHQEMM